MNVQGPAGTATKADPIAPATARPRDAIASQTEEDSSGQATPNGLIECLVHVAKFHGLSANAEELKEGLPSAEHGIPFDSFFEAAARIGFTAKAEQRPLRKVPAVVLPAILVLRNGQCAVLMERRGNKRVAVYTAFPTEGIRQVSLKNLEDDYSGLCIFLTPTEIAPETEIREEPKGKQARWFWPAVATFWPNYLQVAICALLVNILALAAPLFTMNVYDRVIPNLAIPTLWALTIGVGIALLFDFLLRLLRTSIVDQTGRRVDMAISARLYDHLLALRLLSRPPSSGDVSNQIREFDSVRDLLTSNTVVAILDTLFIGLFLFVIWQLVGPLAYVVAAAVPLVITVTLLCQLPLDRATKQVLKDSGRRHGLLFETLSGLETIKSTGAASWMRRKWDRNVAVSARSAAQSRFWNGLAFTFLSTVQQSVSILVTVWGVFLILDGEITMGAVIATNILSGRILAPLANVAQTMTRLSQARSAVGSLNRFMNLPTDRKDTGPSVAPPLNTKTELNAENLTIAYPEAVNPALENVSFRVEAGERVGLIGLVGAGKSTLGRTLAGLYEPSKGHVLLNGVDCGQIGPATLRKAVMYCGQDPDIFSGTVRDNILMSRPYATESEFMSAARMSGLDAHVAQSQQGYDMPVLERGRNLSGGQRQALALARVLISAPDFLFLDEPSAAMDKRAEKSLMQHLDGLANKGTALLIATHKDTVLSHIDRLLVLDKGRLVLDGPKEEVLQKLASMQAQAQKAADNG